MNNEGLGLFWNKKARSVPVEQEQAPTPARFAGFVAGQPHFFIYYVFLLIFK